MIAAHEALAPALRLVKGVRLVEVPGAEVDPPAVALGPPTWTYEVYGPEPSATSLTVAVVVAADDRALERLAALVPQVVEALHEHSDATVTRAEPGTWPSGSVDLPAYLLTIEV